MALERSHRVCVRCGANLGYSRRLYCSNACKQWYYRRKLNDFKPSRKYRKTYP